MNDLSDQARAVLDAGRELDNPTNAARERARRAVLARIAAAGTAAALSTGASAAAVPMVKIMVPVILALAGGVGGGVWWQAKHQAPTHSPTTAAAVSTPAAPSAVVPVFAPPTPAPEPLAAAPVPPLRAHHWQRGPIRPAIAARHVPAAAPPSDSLQDETALLARANAALRAGDTGAGLALLDDYDRRFPSGTLREETGATRIIARCQAASPGAVEAARRFIERHPHSPLSSRVRSSCLIKPER
ncbi:MAG TPA: hypothetical protein VGL59_25040 [Polyangia bacterium]|jgi:hypothetical protein